MKEEAVRTLHLHFEWMDGACLRVVSFKYSECVNIILCCVVYARMFIHSLWQEIRGGQ